MVLRWIDERRRAKLFDRSHLLRPSARREKPKEKSAPRQMNCSRGLVKCSESGGATMGSCLCNLHQHTSAPTTPNRHPPSPSLSLSLGLGHNQAFPNELITNIASPPPPLPEMHSSEWSSANHLPLQPTHLATVALIVCSGQSGQPSVLPPNDIMAVVVLLGICVFSASPNFGRAGAFDRAPCD